MEAEIAGGRKEGARTRYFEGIRALNKKQGFLKSTLHRFYGSLPDESTLEVGQCIMVGKRVIFKSSTVPEMMWVGLRQIHYYSLNKTVPRTGKSSF